MALTGLESRRKVEFPGLPEPVAEPEIRPTGRGYPKWPLKWCRIKGLGRPESEVP